MKGNQMKMREALEAMNRIDTRGLKRLLWELVESDIPDGGLINKTISAVEKARRALSAPPRNCDVGTAEEQDERFHEFCSNHRGSNDRSGNICGMCPLSPINCLLVWALMPYEAEGGQGK